MVDSETIETKFEEKKEELGEKVEEKKAKFDDKKEERKEKFEDRKEKGKNIADNVANDLSKTIEEFKENIKSMQKIADQKFNEYKQTTVQSLDVDFLEGDDAYFIKVAVPGIEKDEIEIEAGDNDIKIEATFKPYIDEFEEGEAVQIMSTLKRGRCVKTIRFENSINVEEISAKFSNGTVIISAPKLVIPKHKVNVE